MSNEWLRLWHDLPNDPKWRTIAKVSKQPITAVISVYIHLLVSASTAPDRGRPQSFNNEDVASALDLEMDQIAAILAAMDGRVINDGKLSGWEKRQPNREDGSAERSKANREKAKLQKELQELKEKLSLTDSTSSEQSRPHPTAPDRNQPIDTEQNKTIVVVKDKSLLDSPRELEIVDNFEEGLDFNDIIVCFDVAVALLGKDSLDDLDRSALLAWHEIYDMRKFFVIVHSDLTKRLQKKQKTPNSLRFFEYVIKKLPAEKPPDLEKILG